MVLLSLFGVVVSFVWEDVFDVWLLLVFVVVLAVVFLLEFAGGIVQVSLLLLPHPGGLRSGYFEVVEGDFDHR